jgi:hypothetical protein
MYFIALFYPKVGLNTIRNTMRTTEIPARTPTMGGALRKSLEFPILCSILLEDLDLPSKRWRVKRDAKYRRDRIEHQRRGNPKSGEGDVGYNNHCNPTC